MRLISKHSAPRLPAAWTLGPDRHIAFDEVSYLRPLEFGDLEPYLLAGCGFNLRKLLRMLPLWRFKEPMVPFETLWSVLLDAFKPKWQSA